jgi:hypothetical protein
VTEQEQQASDGTPADFLEEEKPGVAYIRPHIEINLSDKKRHECREIVKEIKQFGVNQRQILFLIDLLALELENNDQMRRIRAAVVESREKMAEKKSGLILPGDE